MMMPQGVGRFLGFALLMPVSVPVPFPAELEKFFAAIADIMGAWLPDGASEKDAE
jgi:hypothetical protein